MSLLAIAAIMQDRKVIGARIFNTNNCRMQDYSCETILSHLRGGAVIKNLGFTGFKLDWTNGSYTRYPRINGAICENSNVLTVISVINGEPKKYNVISYDGRQAILTEEQLIFAADKYGLSNCKLVNKSKTRFIQSISGKLDEEDKGELKVVLENPELLKIQLPNDGSITSIDIMSNICGLSTSNVVCIRAEPKSSALRVKKLTFASNIGNINMNMVKPFINIETLVIKHPMVRIENKAFSDFRELKEVYINGNCQLIGSNAFMNCVNLRKVVFHKGCSVIANEAFRNCVTLDVNDILKQDIGHIQQRVFKGIPADEICVHSGIGDIGTQAFNGMKGLKKVILNTNSLNILAENPGEVEPNFDENTFLGSYPSIDVVMTKGSVKGLKNVRNNVNFISALDSSYDTDKEIKESIALFKAKLAGYSGRANNKPDGDQDLKVVLQISSQKDLERSFIYTFETMMACNSYVMTDKIGCFQVSYHCDPFRCRDKGMESTKFNECKVYKMGKINYVLMTDKEFINKMPLSNIVRYGMIMLPIFRLPKSGKVESVKKIKDGDGIKLKLTFKNGETCDICSNDA